MVCRRSESAKDRGRCRGLDPSGPQLRRPRGSCGVVATHLEHLFAGGPDVTAYVVELHGRLIGVADVERLTSASAEVAFLVADDMHGRGVATLLLERAARDAAAGGVDWFTSDVLARNHEMLEVFTDIGFVVAFTHEGSDVGVRMSTVLDRSAAAASASRRAAAQAGPRADR